MGKTPQGTHRQVSPRAAVVSPGGAEPLQSRSLAWNRAGELKLGSVFQLGEDPISLGEILKRISTTVRSTINAPPAIQLVFGHERESCRPQPVVSLSTLKLKLPGLAPPLY